MSAQHTVQLAADSTAGEHAAHRRRGRRHRRTRLLVTVVKLHPLISLTLGALTVGVVAGENLNDTVESFSTGVGTTVAGRRAADRVRCHRRPAARRLGRRRSDRRHHRRPGQRPWLPWAMALVGALIGLPMFFEIGLVLLIPVIVLVARRSGQPMMRVGIPALAGLSVMHGLVPPHPGPLLAIDAVNADLGLTLGLGILVAIPTVIIAGPMFSRLAAQWVPVGPPTLFDRSRGRASAPPEAELRRDAVHSAAAGRTDAGQGDRRHRHRRRGGPDADRAGLHRYAVDRAARCRAGRDVHARSRIGACPTTRSAHRSRSRSRPIAGITFIVAAGGGFKQVLVDSGIADVIKDAVEGSDFSPILLAWVRRGPDQAGDRLGDGRHHHDGRDHGVRRNRPHHTPHLAAGARDRLRLAVLLARQRRRLLAGQGVLRSCLSARTSRPGR